MEGTLRIQEDEMILLCLEEEAAAAPADNRMPAEKVIPKPAASAVNPQPAETLQLTHFAFHEFGPDAPGETSFLRSHFVEEPCFAKNLSGHQDLIPWHEMEPGLTEKAGMGIYTGTLNLETPIPAGQRLILDLGDVYDTFTVRVNGEGTAFPDQVMKRADLTNLVRPGRNEIEIRVVSELHNRLMPEALREEIPGMPAIPFIPRKYGIFPHDGKSMELYFAE